MFASDPRYRLSRTTTSSARCDQGIDEMAAEKSRAARDQDSHAVAAGTAISERKYSMVRDRPSSRPTERLPGQQVARLRDIGPPPLRVITDGVRW